MIIELITHQCIAEMAILPGYKKLYLTITSVLGVLFIFIVLSAAKVLVRKVH